MTTIANNDKKVETTNNLISDIENKLITIKKELYKVPDDSLNKDYEQYFDNKKRIYFEQINALKNILDYLNDMNDMNNIDINDKKNIEKDLSDIQGLIDKLKNSLEKIS